MQISLFNLGTLLVALVGAVLGVANFVVDLRRHRPCAKISVRRAVVGTVSERAYEVIALRIHNSGIVPLAVDTVGVYLDKLHGDFVEVEPVDFKGEPLVVRIESGDTLTLRIPFDTFRGCASRKLDSFFVRLADETEFHVRIGRKCRNLALVGAEADEESFGDVLFSAVLGQKASDEDVAKVCEAVKGKCARQNRIHRAESHFMGFPSA